MVAESAADAGVVRARLWETFTSEGIEAFDAVTSANDPVSDGGASWIPHARRACDRFLLSLKVANDEWADTNCRLSRCWLRRQLVTEKNISTVLVFLDDLVTADYFMRSACHTFDGMVSDTGRTDWLVAMDEDMQRLVVCLSLFRSRKERTGLSGITPVVCRNLLLIPGHCECKDDAGYPVA